VLLPVLLRLPVQDEDLQPLLFACENDHDAVNKLKKGLLVRMHGLTRVNPNPPTLTLTQPLNLIS